MLTKKLLGLIILLSLAVPAFAETWVAPDDHNDVDGWWLDETNAYDDSNSTYAYEQGYQPPGVIIYEWTTAVKASKYRIDCVWRDDNTYFYDPELKVELYYSGSWHTVHDGVMDTATVVDDHEFFEDDTDSGENAITLMRITPDYYPSATRKLWIWQIGLKRNVYLLAKT